MRLKKATPTLYDMFSLKVPAEQAAIFDKMIQLSKSGVFPGHVYNNRSDMIRAGLNLIIEQMQGMLADEAFVEQAVRRMVLDVREGAKPILEEPDGEAD